MSTVVLICFLVLVLPGLALAATSPSRRTNRCIGIDLGTTYSAVGVWENGRVELLQNDLGNRITPSVVHFDGNQTTVGDAARQMLRDDPDSTLYAAKRLIGRRFSDDAVQQDMATLSYTVVDDGLDRPLMRVGRGAAARDMPPEFVSAHVLQYMKGVAEDHFDGAVDRAVITVPAYFNEAQREATRDAARIAGLNVSRIINEPTAAAIAHGLDKKGDETNVLVFDLGGGTFDVSVLTIDQGYFEVLATAGDTHLGGEDFDNRLVLHLARQFKRRTGIDIMADTKALARLRKAAEAAKRQLSSQHIAAVEVDSIVPGHDMHEVVTRARFEELNADLFQQVLRPVQRALTDAKLRIDQIDDVVLVGGSTRIPKVRALLTDFFGGKPPLDSVNPDEAVAYGAAVQAAVVCEAAEELRGEDGIVLVDVTPLSLGVEVTGSVMHALVPRGTQLPVARTSSFSTAQDNQETVEIKVYEGERSLTRDNRLLGTFKLSGIQPKPRGVPVIEITFAVDENSLLTVTAVDKTEGGVAAKSVVVSAEKQGRLAPEEVQRLVDDAAANSARDSAIRERIAARHELGQVLDTIAAASVAVPSSVADLVEDAQELLKFEQTIDMGAATQEESTLAAQRLTDAVASLRRAAARRNRDTDGGAGTTSL